MTLFGFELDFNSVVAPQHKQFRILGHVPPQQHRRDREQLPSHLVHQ
ncbi:hypothetical protein ACFV2U_02740 [Streptomyces sp. NPDC059697]